MQKKTLPVLKWAGGKRRLLPILEKHIPSYNKYFEPFLGGGALLFHIKPSKAIINDANFELMNFYNVVKENPQELILDLKQHIDSKEYFYYIRNLDRDVNLYSSLSNVKKASRFLFLNKTVFCGIYRVTKNGFVNVSYNNRSFNLPENNILEISDYLNKNNIILNCGDYIESLRTIEKDDFVYFDPPYHNSYDQYTIDKFRDDKQIELKNICIDLHERGIKFLLSNSATDFIKNLYKDFNQEIIDIKYCINPAKQIKKSQEILVFNF